MTKKKIIVIVSIILVILIGISLSYIFLKKDNTKEEIKEEKPKETIILKENLNYEINSELNLLSLVSDDNKLKVLSDDETIDTSTLGEKEISIKYEVEEREETKTFKITIIDTQAPAIEYQKELTTIVGTKLDLLKDVKITDNSKEEIKVNIEGNYDFNKDGTYNLKYVAIDSSNNKTEEEFTLKVNKKQTTTTNTKPSNNSSNKNNNSTTNTKPNNNINNNKDNDTTTTKPNTDTSSNNPTSNDNKKEEIADNKEDKKYIGVADPNNFNYSFHHGVIEYKDLETCINESYEIGYKDSIDIQNMWCSEVIDSENTILGYYLYINCISGNCNKYKN